MTWDTTYIVGKLQGYRGRIHVSKSNIRLTIHGIIKPQMIACAIQAMEGECDDLQVWLYREDVPNEYEHLLPFDDLNNWVWLH